MLFSALNGGKGAEPFESMLKEYFIFGSEADYKSKIISLTPSENERYELMKYPVSNMIPVVDKRYNYDMA